MTGQFNHFCVARQLAARNFNLISKYDQHTVHHILLLARLVTHTHIYTPTKISWKKNGAKQLRKVHFPSQKKLTLGTSTELLVPLAVTNL